MGSANYCPAFGNNDVNRFVVGIHRYGIDDLNVKNKRNPPYFGGQCCQKSIIKSAAAPQTATAGVKRKPRNQHKIQFFRLDLAIRSGRPFRPGFPNAKRRHGNQFVRSPDSHRPNRVAFNSRQSQASRKNPQQFVENRNFLRHFDIRHDRPFCSHNFLKNIELKQTPPSGSLFFSAIGQFPESSAHQ